MNNNTKEKNKNKKIKESLLKFFDNKEIRKKIKSENFDYSMILIRKREKLDMTFDEISEIAQFDGKQYIKMEYGDLDVDKKDFELAIKNIEKYEESL